MLNKRQETDTTFRKNTGRLEVRRLLVFAFALILLLVLVTSGGCYIRFGPEERTPSSSATEEQERPTTMAPDYTETSAAAGQTEEGGTSEVSAQASEATALTATEGSTAAATETPGSASATAPANTSNMYSSYAILTAFDPSTGVASFDYFDMLRGEAAIDWLVEQEGYSRADAEALVGDFGDSEFVYKNVNPQLRYANMSITAIKMMYNPDGSDLYNSDSIPFTYDQFLGLYAAHPELVVNSPYFYHCTVTGNTITGVDQVYWP